MTTDVAKKLYPFQAKAVEKLPKRFLDKVQITSGCWIWLAGKNESGPMGYGQFYVEGRTVYAHRFSYETLVGEVPSGKQLDHLCKNRLCVNPEHLQPVTPRLNSLRGETGLRNPPTHNVTPKTHCPQGHEYTLGNTYLIDGRWKRCRACNRIYSLRSYWRRKHGISI